MVPILRWPSAAGGGQPGGGGGAGAVGAGTAGRGRCRAARLAGPPEWGGRVRGRAGEAFSSRGGPPPPGGRGPAARGRAPGTPTEKGGGHARETGAGGGRGGGGAAGGRGRGAGPGGAHRLQPQPDTGYRGVWSIRGPVVHGRGRKPDPRQRDPEAG